MRTSIALLAVSLSSLSLVLAADKSATPPRQSGPYQIRTTRSSGEVSRVEINLEYGGELKVQHGDKVNPLKMSVVGQLDYQERIVGYPASEEGSWRSVRHYDSATATLKIGQSGVKPSLRNERRLVSVAVRGTSTTLYSPSGTLSREELDLLNIAGNGIANSLVLDRLLPVRPVAMGESWGHSRDVVGALVGLDTVEKSDVESKLIDVTKGVARLQMAGRVAGTSEGSTVEMEIKAKYQVDLKTKRVNWLGLLVRENRQIGEVVPGADVVLRLEMKITPLKESKQLTDAVVQALPTQPPAGNLDLEHRSADGVWSLSYDRDWYVTADERDLTVLKLMDQGQRIVQCNLSSLSQVDVAKLPTLAEFQEEVRTALGKNFGEFVEASQSSNQVHYRVYRVVARGTVNDLPIEWHYYLVANERGQQAAFAFTIDAGLARRLSSVDKLLVNQLRFADPKLAAKPTPAK
jgi:hypothetical protein